MAASLAIYGNFYIDKGGRRRPAPPKKVPQANRVSLGVSFSEPVLRQAPPGPQPLKLPGIVQLGASLEDNTFSPADCRAQLFAVAGHPNQPDRLYKTGSLRRRPGRPDKLRLPDVHSLHVSAGARLGTGHPEHDNEDTPFHLVAQLSRARPSLLEVGLLNELEQSSLDHNLSGPVALAFALIAKCGTLEKAWERFDLNRSGRISRWQWDSALTTMHLDTDRVCGASANKLFSQLSHGSQVTHDAWNSFFKPFVDDPATSSALQEALKQFENTCEEERRRHGDKRGERAHREKPRIRASGNAASSLKEAVDNEARMSKDELAEVELQASAESLQLQEELTKHNLSGDHALAYILAAKFGSLRKAFRWFNSNGSGRLSNNEWDTGIRIMRLDLQKLTGNTSQDFFRIMQQGKNLITHSDWNDFFQQVMETAPSGFADILAGAASSANASLAERAKLKKEQLRKSKATKSRGEEGQAAEGREGEAGQTGQGSNQIAGGGGQTEEERFRLKDDEISRGGAEGTSKNEGVDGKSTKGAAEGKSEEASANGNASGTHANIKRDGALDDSSMSSERLAIRAKLGELSEEELSFRERIFAELSQLEFGKSAEFFSEQMRDLDERKLLIIEDVAMELSLFAHVLKGGHVWSDGSIEPDGIMVFNLGDFPQEALQQLRAIELHSSFQFPTNLSGVQRQVVHLIGRSMGLWTKSEGRGQARYILAFNVGDFAAEVREQLKELKPGESKAFPPNLTLAQRKIVHMIATELELTSFSEGAGDERHVEVFNLASFADEVWSELENLESGQQKTFDKDLGRAQRKIVHCIADNLNLSHVSDGAGDQRQVTVGNLRDFRIWVRDELEKLEIGSTKDFDANLSGLQRKIVHELAKEFGMSSSSQGTGSERFVSVTRTEEVSGSTSGSRRSSRRSKEEAEGSQSEDEDSDSDADKLEAIFEDLASGCGFGGKIFSRTDLDNFREEFQDIMPKKRRNNLTPVLNQVYEDSLQLQLDFGTRTKKGLTYRWFQVFIQKVAAKVGFSAMGLLMSFHDDLL